MPPTNANPLSSSAAAAAPASSPNSLPTTANTGKDPQPPPQQLRPPLYNAEDYASALRALFTTSLSLPHHPAPHPTSLILEHASTHPPLIPGQGLVDMNKHSGGGGCGNGGNNTTATGGGGGNSNGSKQQQHHHHHHQLQQQPEMSMKKFINGSELLFKLEADLRSAFPSFVSEFIHGDSDGVTCILDALRTIHEALDHVNGLREQRKLVLDERSCVMCVCLMMRNHDAIPKLLAYPHGLYQLAHCTVSTNTSTRVLALEVLTSVCEHGGEHAFDKVSEAVSTLRLRLGEPIRCKVLVGAISSAAAGVFQATGIRFLRSFVNSAPSARFRVYLQVELEEAGFNADVIRKSAEMSPARESRLVLQELDEWDRASICIDTLQRQNNQLRNSVSTLQQEIATLKDKIKKSSEQTHPPTHSKYTKKRPSNGLNSGNSSSSSSSSGGGGGGHSNGHHRYSNNNNNNNNHHHNQRPPPLSSTPIQTITTPVDSEEEAEQIHQILEDLHNIVNNEMLHNSNNNDNNHHNDDAISTTTTTTPPMSEIVPVLTNRPSLLLNKSSNNKPAAAFVHSEPNLLLFDSSDTTTTTDTATDSPLRVKHVVQQLENHGNGSSTTTTAAAAAAKEPSNTLPNFNTGGLASKFANFKSSKLERMSPSSNNHNNNNWASSSCNDAAGRVKSLENLDNFTLKWKYPVVVGGNNNNGSQHRNNNNNNKHMIHLQQQPSSLVVRNEPNLDYRMNRFITTNTNSSGNNSNTNNKSTSGKGDSVANNNNASRTSPPTSSSSGSAGGLFSKNKKKQQQQQQQQQQPSSSHGGSNAHHHVHPPHHPHHHHPQKTFQLSLVGNSGGAMGGVGVGGKMSNLSYNDLGGGGGGSGSSPSLLELPSGLY